MYMCKYWVALYPGLFGVNSNMHFYYSSWTGLIKLNLQYFDICRVWWLSKFPFHLFGTIDIVTSTFNLETWVMYVTRSLIKMNKNATHGLWSVYTRLSYWPCKQSYGRTHACKYLHTSKWGAKFNDFVEISSSGLDKKMVLENMFLSFEEVAGVPPPTLTHPPWWQFCRFVSNKK
jgi:hypothetical protein